MKSYFAFFVSLIIGASSILFGGCGETKAPAINSIAEGSVHYGGVFRMNEVGDVRSLYPLNITEVASYRIANQVYEGLIKYDQVTLEPKPAIAERWEMNEDATVWKFYLRQDVFFHDNECFDHGKGRNVIAEDVAWSIKQLCTPSDENAMFWMAADRIQGAKEYYESQNTESPLEEISGIEVIDDYTIQIKLNFPTAGLLSILGHNAFYVFPKEALEFYGKDLASTAVGTGPFKLRAFKFNEIAILERNPNYYEKDEFGNQLPYLDALEVGFVKDKKSELLQFKKGELDMIFTLPVEMYSEVMSDLEAANKGANVNFKPQVIPSLSIHFYSFLHQHEVFSDVRVRSAFNLAIDRESIINYTLQGEGSPAIYGFVPPAFAGYDYSKVKGFTFDPVRARELLDDAGFIGGAGFPELTLEISSGGANYERVAQVVQSMLEQNLNIKVSINVLPMGQQLDNAENGDAVFWRDGWVADYPDPENFLCYFVSTGISDVHESTYMNSVRYSNPAYDSLYLRAISEVDIARRRVYYRQLDQMLIDDAVFMPIYYDEFTRLIPIYVKNFPQNSIEYRDFTKVWFDNSMREGKPQS
jgi:oligopeptide transport system substrate-binding protein